MPSFDPQCITPAVSLNRVRIVDLPGVVVDSEVKGRQGTELVSLAVLARLIRQRADSLQLDPHMPDGQLRLALEGCVAHESETVRVAADEVARRVGRNLGYVLLALKRGDAVNRAARSEWDDSYWRHWARIRRVWLGGGLVDGWLGSAIGRHAAAVIEEAGIDDYVVQVSPYASALPLVGVARYAPAGCRTALVLDFGSTMVKCARAVYEDDELIELHRLPSHSARCAEIEKASDDGLQQATKLFSHMVSVVVDAWRAARLLPFSPVLATVATYIRDGHPLLRDGHPLPARGGGYLQLRRITDNVQKELTRRVSAELGETVDLSLVHDGTAAATTYAGMKDAVVVMVGTALGVGFPPEAGRLRAISSNLTVCGPDG